MLLLQHSTMITRLGAQSESHESGVLAALHQIVNTTIYYNF